MKTILVDCFGSDYAPLEILKGASLAKNVLDCKISLVGNMKIIKKVSLENNIDIDGLEIFDCETEITNDDSPLEITRSKKNSSMSVGLQILGNNGADAFVSAGNSGALLVGTSLILKKYITTRRVAIGIFIPAKNKNFLLLDCGANAQCTPEMLLQFAIMSSNYVKNLSKIENPKIGLLNIGTEPFKGDPLRKETFQLLNSSDLNFGGNIEPSSIFDSDFDVVISDGFTGNIFIKTFEGMVKFLISAIEGMFKNQDFNSNESYIDFKKRITSSERGGAPILGVSKTVIKAHGRSDAHAIKNAIEFALNSIGS